MARTGVDVGVSGCPWIGTVRTARTSSLSVIRRLATRPRQRIGSMFVNPGGPGESGVGAMPGPTWTSGAQVGSTSWSEWHVALSVHA